MEVGTQNVTVSFHGGSVSFKAKFWRSRESLIDEARRRLGPLLSQNMAIGDICVERENIERRASWCSL